VGAIVGLVVVLVLVLAAVLILIVFLRKTRRCCFNGGDQQGKRDSSDNYLEVAQSENVAIRTSANVESNAQGLLLTQDDITNPPQESGRYESSRDEVDEEIAPIVRPAASEPGGMRAQSYLQATGRNSAV